MSNLLQYAEGTQIANNSSSDSEVMFLILPHFAVKTGYNRTKGFKPRIRQISNYKSMHLFTGQQSNCILAVSSTLSPSVQLPYLYHSVYIF